MSWIKEGLNAATEQRCARPGDPSSGPYPATQGEVAGEVVDWVYSNLDRIADTEPLEFVTALSQWLAEVQGVAPLVPTLVLAELVRRIVAEHEGPIELGVQPGREIHSGGE